MAKPLRVLLVASEMTPFAKTGGLADVVGALAAKLGARGHDVLTVIPFYRSIRRRGVDSRPRIAPMGVHMGGGIEWCVAHETADSGSRVVLIEHELFFDREGIYHDEWLRDYDDNARRFGFLCRAALQVCLDSNFRPDIVHANDWQTALLPAYLKTWFWNSPILGKAASALTIHNIAHQGVYPGGDYPFFGLDQRLFVDRGFESYGKINFLKGGIVHADVVNTVSPGHARELTTPYGGFGLAPYLSDKGERFVGILNGVDYDTWSPHNDPFIPVRFSADDLSGKARCKRDVQEKFGLEPRDDVCLIGMVSRLADQKGCNLVRDCIDRALAGMRLQCVILGAGDKDLERFFGELPARYPGRAGSYIGYSEELAHCIEAGADFFLMPSLFEPCGLNQMYSLRYGTPPIVRATGGLDDTVEQYDAGSGKGTGFKFHDATADAVYNTIGWAVSVYYDHPRRLRSMIRRAMKKEYSWDKAILNYEKLYRQARRAKRDYDGGFK
jgi:starch synthase